MNKILFFGFTMIVLAGCKEIQQRQGKCSVELTIENGYNQKIYLENIPPVGESEVLLDSVMVKDRVQLLHFVINDKEENLYRVHTRDYRLDIVFINDANTEEIRANYFEPAQVSFKNSAATSSLHAFMEMVKKKTEITRKQDPLTVIKDSFVNSKLQEIQSDYRNYVDSVASPAAALYVYNAVDFGEDRTGLKNYIIKLGNRFPKHSGIQKLVLDTRNYLSIFEEELMVGDLAPDLVLPDLTGKMLPLSFYRGKYLLIDFWASWDGSSRFQGSYKKKAYSQFRNKNFSVVSISLDPEKDMWKQAIDQDGYTWPQLIDEKVWMGPAVYTFKFDSIPFNFLIDPSGKIIGKALYGDSLLAKLNQLIR